MVESQLSGNFELAFVQPHVGRDPDSQLSPSPTIRNKKIKWKPSRKLRLSQVGHVPHSR